MKRRTVLHELVAAAVAAAAPVAILNVVGVATANAQSASRSGNAPRIRTRYLRPPGALAEAQFTAQCIRCGQCGAVCPNRCIRFFDSSNGVDSIDTPYIVPREQACILCMKCGEVCPSGAIQAIARKAGDILAKVKMGQARVDESLCLSYQGKTCGVCYRACPLPDVALTVGHLEQPKVFAACVGCGLCERSCIQLPQAIRVFPATSTEPRV
ncbi:MAG: ferredoxin-type protein NapG [Gammaproteobacteria bacterium]|jgi:ferredoxin-type protein NapG